MIITMGDVYCEDRAEFGRMRGSKNGVRKPPTLKGHLIKGALAGGALGVLGGAKYDDKTSKAFNSELGAEAFHTGKNARLKNILTSTAGNAILGAGLGGATYQAKKLARKIKRNK